MAAHPTELEVGMKAPEFKAIIENGETIKLSDYRGKKLVLFFYPKDNTPGCTAENCNLRDNYDSFVKKGYSLLGVSPDSLEKHQRFIRQHKLPFSLIADEDKEVIKAYGVWGEKMIFGVKRQGLFRTTFVIDEEGKIESVFKQVKTRSHAEQILGE